ncbi:MAG TPA: lysylphosphatidylglycerol synthase transmembrane domain-containing protein [Chitinophagaceae bacterium]|nr:lysylphosphatidylglycerol synthase transmembrane domain-containing protein [Chitinophagaceae bacterium]
MEDAVAKQESKLSKYLKLLLKVAVTVVCFWYISKKIDFSAAKNAFLKANWSWLLLACLLLALSKLFSSFRLNIYFRNIQVRLPEWKNIRLYWLGMFYNLFLPGSISGDAYKVVLLKKKYNAPYKKTSSAVLLDRFSGLLALGLILSVYGVIVLDKNVFILVLAFGSLAAIAGLYFIVRFYFKDFLPAFWSTFFWGLLVQSTQVVCVYCILAALRLPVSEPQWIFIFLIAAVVAVFPISLGGGLGTREVMFVEGAKYFHLDPQVGLVISLLFYLLTVLTSIWGIFFIFFDPLKND